MTTQIEGQKIVKVRAITKKEIMDAFGEDLGDEKTMVLVLDNGAKIFASQDYEGNGQGALFGCDKTGGEQFVVFTE